MSAADIAWLHLDIILTDILISFLYLLSVLVSNCKLAYSSLSTQLPLIFDSAHVAVSNLTMNDVQSYFVDTFNKIPLYGSSLVGCISTADFSGCDVQRLYAQEALPYVSSYALLVAAVILVVKSNQVNKAVKSSMAGSSPFEQTAGKELKVGALSELDSGIKRAAVASTPKDKLSRAIHMQTAFNTISKQKNLLLTPKVQPPPSPGPQTPGSAISGVTMTPRLRTPAPGPAGHEGPMVLPVDSHLGDAPTPVVHYQRLHRDVEGHLRGESSPRSRSGTPVRQRSGSGAHDDTHSVVSHTDRHVAFATQQFVGADGTRTSTATTMSVQTRPVSGSALSRDSAQHALQQSVEFPAALVGWRVHVPPMDHYGDGIVMGVQKKKFRPTHFQIQFDRDPTKLVSLPLQRSLKKGTVPFTLIGRT